MTGRKKKKAAEHVHVAAEVGPVYEYCRCGAVRRRDTVGKPWEPWHVCALCRVGGKP